ncbi:unnamed protein product [Ectocarpus sp. CCAP 1310/34]|nr:unnamed protein product [Ectocarpus sp. CCAP 1310/34]
MGDQEQQANAVKVVVKVVVQNLEKKAGLATRLVEQYQPDILLAQELNRCSEEIDTVSFVLACSWPYPGRDLPLDHAFVRGVQLESSFSYGCESDHNGAVLEISLP